MARKVGRNLFYAIEASDDPIIMLSGSCTQFVREHYPRLFGIGMGIDEVCFEFTEFVTRIAGADIKGSLVEPMKAAYHPACHLLRGLKLKEEPFNLMQGIKNLELIRIEKEETCCGFGGVFSAIYPEVSSKMADEKVQAIRDAGADVVISADAGCLRRMERSGIKAMHIAELLWMGMKR
jgi:L-lactate dehydrogenase complex protein LldE